MTNVKIYALKNPMTNLYFYVGATGAELKKRLNGHMSSTDQNVGKAIVIK
jgi:Uri superfamily endonuclease